VIEENELPLGWVWITLNDLILLSQNGCSKRSSDMGTPTVVLRLGDIENGRISLNNVRKINLSDDEIESYKLLEDDLLCIRVNGSRGFVGRIIRFRPQSNEPVTFCDHFIRFRLVTPKLAAFLSFYFGTEMARRHINLHMVSTAGQNTVSQGTVTSVVVPLPPSAEQQRIIEVIEQQFSRLDKAVALLHQAQKKLKRYRASVLKAAVEGELTKEWREAHPDIEPASELLKHILVERRAKWEEEQIARGKDLRKVKYVEPAVPDVSGLPKLPEGWCWATINQIAGCLDFKRVPINKEERAKRNGTIPYYGANGQVGWIDDYIFDEALVLVVEDETFFGREIPFSYKIAGKSWVNNHAHVLRPTAAVHIDYLNYSLAYYPFTPLTQGTTGRRKLTQKSLLLASYALPPLAEQEQIVSLVEERLSIISELEATIEKALKRAERQRQSILHRAFTGKLVPQDPKDEPASVLLERIREEQGTKKDGKQQRARIAPHKKTNSTTKVVKTPDKPAEPIDTADIAQESLWQGVEA
jgi:type I restriction enzyme S subunit